MWKKSEWIRCLMQTALLPVGYTLYIWGGGWNVCDTGAGEDAMRIGVSPRWKAFFCSQDETYDAGKHRYERENGLDCSGYMGWLLYNVLSRYGMPGNYVRKAGEQGPMLAECGFGTWKEAGRVTDWYPGDIMSSEAEGHIFLVLEECEDGSLLICHSSPPGVQVNGTVRPDGAKESIAVKKAEACMKRISPEWCKRYDQFWKGNSYLTEYGQFRWW